jgi:hypothetical protein
LWSGSSFVMVSSVLLLLCLIHSFRFTRVRIVADRARARADSGLYTDISRSMGVFVPINSKDIYLCAFGHFIFGYPTATACFPVSPLFLFVVLCCAERVTSILLIMKG